MVDQIDAEMDERLQAISNNADDAWEGFVRRCHAYLEMALEPEMQRIVLCDAKAVLGGASPESHQYCVGSMEGLIQVLMDQGRIEQADPHALASLIYGSLAEAAFWILKLLPSNTDTCRSE